jgi:hypothetical protein
LQYCVRFPYQTDSNGRTTVPHSPSSACGKVPDVKLHIDNACTEVDYIATGFMMIERSVLEKLKRECPELAFVNDMKDYQNAQTAGNFYDLFQCTIDPMTRAYTGEDYSFCRLCKKHDIPIYCDLSSTFVHTGTFNFRGSIATFLGLDKNASAVTGARTDIGRTVDTQAASSLASAAVVSASNARSINDVQVSPSVAASSEECKASKAQRRKDKKKKKNRKMVSQRGQPTAKSV